jgi:hypothetical protein
MWGAFLGLGLVGLCVYSSIVGPQHTYDMSQLLADPSRSAGLELELGYTQIEDISNREFRVQRQGTRLSVWIPTRLQEEWERWQAQLEVGDYVSLRAVLLPEGHLSLQDLHIHKGRRLKIWVSLIAVGLLAGMVLHEHRQKSLGHA